MPRLAASGEPSPMQAPQAMAAGQGVARVAWEHVLDEGVTDLAWGGDGGRLLGATADGEILGLPATAAGGEYRVHAHAGGVARLAVHASGATFASAGEDGLVRLWDLATGAGIDTLAREPQWVDHIAWAPDGSRLAITAGARLSIWRDTRVEHAWEVPAPGLGDIAWAPDGRRIAVAVNKALYLWRPERGDPQAVMSFPGAAVSAAWSADGSALAAGTQDGFLQVWKREPGGRSRQLTMKGYRAKVAHVAWHPRHAVVATSGGQDVVVWNMTRPGASRPLTARGHARTVTALAFAPHGGWIASGDRAGRLCLWDARGQLCHEQEAGAEVTRLAWSPDGARLAVGTRYGHVALLDVAPPPGRQ